MPLTIARTAKNDVQHLPHGWMVTDPKKLKEQLESKQKWAEGNNTILPHFLREDKINAKILRHADNPEPYKTTIKDGGKCVVVECSTGCYYAVCVPLIRGGWELWGTLPSGWMTRAPCCK